MDERVYELLNDQINKELYSAYLYMSFADYYEDEGLSGFANWYMIQAAEERDHALIFRKYLLDNGKSVQLKGHRPARQDVLVVPRAAGGRARAREVRDEPDQRHLRCGPRREGLPHHEVPGLVHRGAAGGGSERRGHDHEDELFGTDAKALYDLDREYAARAYTAPTPLANA